MGVFCSMNWFAKPIYQIQMAQNKTVDHSLPWGEKRKEKEKCSSTIDQGINFILSILCTFVTLSITKKNNNNK